jgi:hypothetical protein
MEELKTTELEDYVDVFREFETQFHLNIEHISCNFSSSSFGIQLSIHWMITSCCACVGIRNNNKFSQFITYLQVVPTETARPMNIFQVGGYRRDIS